MLKTATCEHGNGEVARDREAGQVPEFGRGLIGKSPARNREIGQKVVPRKGLEPSRP
jgi:hypothetical protein